MQHKIGIRFYCIYYIDKILSKLISGCVSRRNSAQWLFSNEIYRCRGCVVPAKRPSTSPGLGNDQDDPVVRFNLLRRRAGK